jgi:putative phosphoribosyl transferase
VIVVDDGLATGTTMRAAIVALRAHHPHRLVVAVPVIARECCATFGGLADALIWLIAPEPFVAVGNWYLNFAPTSDAEVCDLLDRAPAVPHGAPHAPVALAYEDPVES